MVRQIKATSIKSSPLCEEKHEWASACEPRSQGSRARENRVTPFTGAATERHQSENAQRFLLDLSAEFVSRDYETTLRRLAITTVPFLADFCFFDVLSANGTMQRVSWAHADTLKRPLLDVAVEFVPDRSSMNHPVSNVMRTGQSEFAPEINDAWMSAVATSPRHLALMRDLELRSLIAVPLLVPGLTLGVLTFCYAASSGRHYCREDLWLAEDLAHRTAIVVENARLYHELQDASHRKDEFLAMLGHELRNPLAPIRNAMQILRVKSASAPELQELAALVERQIQQLTRLVDDLLDVSRVGHGKINLQIQPVDLKTVVALAIESSRQLIDARKHVLKDSLPQQAVEV
jgi:K+-sensing histidine kinase KdpD